MRQIHFGRPMIDEAERDAVAEVLRGPVLVHGPRATEFENGFAAATGAPYAISTSSCTAALHLVYFYLGLGAGDEVIVPAMTHVATAHAVELVGAKPVFVDAEPLTGNIDVAQLEAALTPRTRAISIVHFLGVPADMDAVVAFAKKHDLFVVEDCALAVGTRYKGIHAGLLGDVGCFSFYPVKHMTTAEGGMMITRRPELAEKIRRQKAFGVDRHVGERAVPGEYDVTMLGFNYRMSELHAAIGIQQLKKIDAMFERRRANDTALRAALEELDELTPLATTSGANQSSYYCLSVVLSPDIAPRRYEIIASLKERGVGTSIYYPRAVPHFTYYREKYGYDGGFPVASRIGGCSIALPVGPHLDGEDMAYIGDSMKQVLGKVLTA